MNSKNLSAIGYGLLFIGLLVAPLLGAYPVFVMKLMCFALFACAFNLLLGYTGMLSFGHAAFLGGAAYVAGHSMKVWGFSPEVSLLLGTLSGGLLGLVVGFFAIRRQGIDMGRPDVPIPIATDTVGAVLVHQDEEHIHCSAGLPWGRRAGRDRG